MDLNFSPEETAFRDEVRRFVGESLPFASFSFANLRGEAATKAAGVVKALTSNGKGFCTRAAGAASAGQASSAAPAGALPSSTSSRRSAPWAALRG